MDENHVPTEDQIKAEIEELKRIKPKVPHHTTFGEDNWKAIDAQIETLENKYDQRKISKFLGALDEEGTEDIFEYESALEALEWTQGTANQWAEEDEHLYDPPSVQWKYLISE
jgi:hypothetical protein